VPTCALEEKISDARDRIRAAGWDACVVVNKERVVLGLLREKELALDPEVEVEQVMRNGPTTTRPNEPLEKMAKRMRDRGGAYRAGDDLGRQVGGIGVPGGRRTPSRRADVNLAV
jgi:CBS domain-containing protein